MIEIHPLCSPVYIPGMNIQNQSAHQALFCHIITTPPRYLKVWELNRCWLLQFNNIFSGTFKNGMENTYELEFESNYSLQLLVLFEIIWVSQSHDANCLKQYIGPRILLLCFSLK